MKIMLILLKYLLHVKKGALGKFHRVKLYLFSDNKLCMPQCSMCELLVKEAHGGGLIGHYGITKTLDVFARTFFFWLE